VTCQWRCFLRRSRRMRLDLPGFFVFAIAPLMGLL
jgi:hypothetical protein